MLFLHILSTDFGETFESFSYALREADANYKFVFPSKGLSGKWSIYFAKNECLIAI